MNRKIPYFIILVLIIIGILFLFSGCEFIQELLGPGNSSPSDNGISANAAHILKNWDFDDPGSSDNPNEYVVNNETYYDTYDWIEGWMDYFQGSGIRFLNTITKDAYFTVDLGNFPGGSGGQDGGADNAYLVLTQSINNDTSNTVETDLQQDIYYTVKSNTKFRTKLRITSFSGGNASYPFVYILAYINGKNYVLLAASPDGPNKWRDGKNVISTTGEWDYYQVDLSGLVVDEFPGIWGTSGNTYTIRDGDKIDSILIVVGSNYSNVSIDYVDIYEE